MTNDQWRKLFDYARESLLRKADPTLPQTIPFPEAITLPHRGFFFGLVNPKGEELARDGALCDETSDLKASVDGAIERFHVALQEKKISSNALKTGTLHLCLVREIVFLKEPLAWDDSKDGVCFSWGDRYKGMYLPYQVQRSESTKIEIMEKLCAWESHVPSNLWQYPEGLVYKLVCESFSN